MNTIYAHHDPDKYRLGIPVVKVGLTEVGTSNRVCDSLHAGDGQAPFVLAEVESVYNDHQFRTILIKSRGWRLHHSVHCAVCASLGEKGGIPGKIPTGFPDPKEHLHPPKGFDTTEANLASNVQKELELVDVFLRASGGLPLQAAKHGIQGTPSSVVRSLQKWLTIEPGKLYLEVGDAQEGLGTFARALCSLVRKNKIADISVGVVVANEKARQELPVVGKQLRNLGITVFNTISEALEMSNKKRVADGFLPFGEGDVEVFGNPPYALGKNSEKDYQGNVAREFARRCAADTCIRAITYVTPITQVPKEFLPNLRSVTVTEGSFGMPIQIKRLAAWRWERGYIGKCSLTDDAGITADVDLKGLELLPLRHEHLEAIRSIPEPKLRGFGNPDNFPFRGFSGDADGSYLTWLEGSKKATRKRVPIREEHFVFLKTQMLEEGLINHWKLFGTRGVAGGSNTTGKAFTAAPGETIQPSNTLYFTHPDKQIFDLLSQIWVSTPIQFLIHIGNYTRQSNAKSFRYVPDLTTIKWDGSNPKQLNQRIYQQLGWSDSLVNIAESWRRGLPSPPATLAVLNGDEQS